MNFVDGEIIEFFDAAAGPANFDRIELGSGAEAEVHAHVIVGIVAGAAADFVNEDASTGFHGDAGADGVAAGAEVL